MAQSARSGDAGSAIAKDLIDNSEDPKHMLFCRSLRAFSGVILPIEYSYGFQGIAEYP